MEQCGYSLLDLLAAGLDLLPQLQLPRLHGLGVGALGGRTLESLEPVFACAQPRTEEEANEQMMADG